MHYYALSYVQQTKTDNRFRRTRVESRNPKYSLSYRRGYYATDSKTGLGAADAQDPLLPLMGFGLPDMAQIVYKLSVTPSSVKPSGSSGNAASNPKGPTTHYTLDYGVSLNQVKLDVQPDGSRRAQLEVKAVAYDDAGKPLDMTGQRGLLNITPEGLQEARVSGVHFQEELDLPSNTDIHLRTGVYDLSSGNAGTLGVKVHTQVAGKIAGFARGRIPNMPNPRGEGDTQDKQFRAPGVTCPATGNLAQNKRLNGIRDSETSATLLVWCRINLVHLRPYLSRTSCACRRPL